MTDAEQVKHTRKLFGYTQKEFGELLRTSKQTISNWENGKPVPPTSMMAVELLEREYQHFENQGLTNSEIKAQFYEPSVIKQTTFIREHHHKIVKEALKYKNKVGYLSMFVDEDYNFSLDDLEFIEGEFDQDEFTLISNSENDHNGEIVAADFIYYSLKWVETKTKNNIKELLLTGKVDPSKLNLSE